ncbi:MULTISPECIES: hypothetical protein [Streptomyces]|uniref:hypothetical protein n=1 Tax=Streptomyces TaxID=1883 RepID=UPI0029D3DCD9|nr:hypothetical protein [Streptomyces sp. F8]MDX6763025.1 hypothetical protein [Streptomyces sp. F8]
MSALDRWVRHYRAGGVPALVSAQRQVTPRTPVEVLDLAAALKKEYPARTAAQIQRSCGQHRAGRRQTGRCSGTSLTPA